MAEGGTGAAEAPSRAPDFLCIGAQKAATTWLADTLSQHPDIWRPWIKELHFFNAEAAGFPLEWRARIAGLIGRRADRLAATPGRLRAVARLRRLADPARMDGFDWYLAYFGAAPPALRVGDFTPRYSTLPEAAVERLAARLPEARFLWLIREPASRAASAFRMAAARQRIDPADRAALDAMAREWLAAGKHRRGDYADYVPRWDAQVPPERMLHIAYGDVARRPAAALARIEAFLGLPAFTGWRGAEERRRPTAPLDLPPWLADEIEAHAAPHRAFLAARFGADFAARCA